MLGTTPNSVTNFFVQTASFVASNAAIYSDSVVDLATVSYVELFHLIASPFKQNTNPNYDVESSWSV